jgi:tetratricopeptide (TPR) repeat protein
VRRGALLIVVLTSACVLAAADHERLGDRAYREGRFTDAIAEYRAALKGGSRGALLAKLGAAGLHGNDLGTALDAYSGLADSDPSEVGEAAAGLERVARQAERGGSMEVGHLAAAVRALRSKAPGRPLGRFALAPTTGLPATEALGALPAGLASAVDGRTVDSLLVAYGAAQQTTTACDAATRTFQTVLRRTRENGLRARASTGLATCALRLGLDAMQAEDAVQAERWFEAAVSAAGASPAGWRAAIGLGDARMSQGDLLGAAIAWQGVLSATGVPDTLVKQATAKLNALGAAPPDALKDSGT